MVAPVIPSTEFRSGVLPGFSMLKPGAPAVNPAKPDNILSRSKIRRGNAEEALRASAHTVSGTWKTQRVELAISLIQWATRKNRSTNLSRECNSCLLT